MADAGSPLRASAARTRQRLRGNRLATVGLVILSGTLIVAALAPLIAPYQVDAMGVGDRLAGPSLAHPFGTDRYGRDLFSRVVMGTRIAATVALSVPALAAAIGVPVGLFAADRQGLIGAGLMRVMDALFAFPAVLLGLTLVAVFGQSLTNIVVALAIVFVPQFARVTRSAAVEVVEDAHVAAARAMGASRARVLAVHVFPFCLSAVLVQASTTAGLAIILESSLSFLGVGVPPPRPSWGTMLRAGKGFLETAPWYSAFPGLAIVVTVMGFNLLGDGLRDAFDPRSGGGRF
ncbi:MAG: ABC transporter permease [Halobacteriaceae archaeon]